MDEGKAMANAALIEDERRGSRQPFAVESADLALTRNEVMHEALGGRTWIGALTNVTGRLCADVAVHIRFHDSRRRPVGSPVSAQAAWLAPGAGLHLQARLPMEATGLQIGVLRWTADGQGVEFGPCDPRAFGNLRH
jgi:hypothetical protein